jgi:hypothetical protein
MVVPEYHPLQIIYLECYFEREQAIYRERDLNLPDQELYPGTS